MPSTRTNTPCSPPAPPPPPVGRTPFGVEIVTGEDTPVRLPGEKNDPALRLLARVGGEYLFVGLRGTVRDTPPPHPEPTALPLAPGDICFYDTLRTPALDFPERFRATVFLVRADLLGLAGPDVRRITRSPVAHASRLGTLLSPLLSDLARTSAEARPPVGEMLAWNAVNLLATLATEQLGGQTPGTSGTSGVPVTPGTSDPAGAARPPVLERILEYVELHLTDPDLAPDAIARAHHISVRHLHNLFKDQGTTVGRWILRRRLEECRRDLMRYGRGSRTIAAVAARWGFLSATHFSRVFRAAYGMSPSEWRERAGGTARSLRNPPGSPLYEVSRTARRAL